MDSATFVNILLSVLGALMLRALSKLDKTTDALTAEVVELKTERKAQLQHNDFLNKRMDAQEARIRALEVGRLAPV